MRIHDFVFLSNHFHLLASVASVDQQKAFLRFLGWIAIEVHHVHDWEGKVWRRRARSIPISDEERAQVARLRYLFAQGVKENLVASPEDWPGTSSVSARLRGYRSIEGDWVDRSEMHRARQRRLPVRERDFTSPETVELSPLPAWAHLSWSQYRDHVRDLVDEIRQEARSRHRSQGTRPLGVRTLFSVDPRERPQRSKRSPAPRFHAATREAYLQFREAYARFLEAYHDASRRFRDGDRSVCFPEGCFPPAPAYGLAWSRPP